MRRLRVLPEAEAELTAAAEWYEQRYTGLGIELVAVIDRALERIQDNPETFPVWKADYPYRQCVVRRFPYVVFFTFGADDVDIVAFAHAKRRPGYWMARK